ncbi:hypothetical protein K7X08_009064 [Anisodus acutangulus]|uniref:Uncharacterized protein n=1 Tax=Anisodus acutangulus TaxID=402998 RepID=A0A9Q1MZ68_9SOLA|nr:hypothetical protein K7X08_009064 [Anisodus acutangulus]
MDIAIHPPIRTLAQDFITGLLPRKAPIPPNATNAKLTAAMITAILTLWKCECMKVKDYDPETESEEDQQVVKLAEPSKNVVYNSDGLLDKLRDIGCPDGVDRSNMLNINKEEQEVVDMNDDCARELSILMQALEAARRDSQLSVKG